jgi:Putative cell-wall binding lipoprotein.
MVEKLKKWTGYLLVIAIFAALSGCGRSVEEKIYSLLEKVAEKESGFAEQQKPLLELEKKEGNLYEEILETGLKEREKIVRLSEEALSVLENQRKQIAREKEFIDSGRESFENLNKYIDELDDDSLRKLALQLEDLMTERYNTYDRLYNQYLEQIEQNEELYRLLQKEDVTIDELEPQVEKINESSGQLQELNDRFNELTEEYNLTKINFYKKAGLNIRQEDEKRGS